MKILAMLISIAGLVLTLIPSFFVLYGVITWTLNVQLMFAGMVMWFFTAPLWMKTD
jgi:hypothetical protein